MLRNIIYKLALRKGALIRAAMYGDADSVSFYLNHGVDPNVTGRKGITPLACAALNGHEDIVDLLLESGADANILFPIGGTALCAAARNNRIKIMSKLIRAGADINRASTDLLLTPLMAVAGHGHLEAVKLLLAAGANPSLMDTRGDTASSLAARHSFGEVVQVLQDAERESAGTSRDKKAPTPSRARERLSLPAVFTGIQKTISGPETESETVMHVLNIVAQVGIEDRDVFMGMMKVGFSALQQLGEEDIRRAEKWLGTEKKHWSGEQFTNFNLGYIEWLRITQIIGTNLPEPYSQLSKILSDIFNFPKNEIPLTDDIRAVYKAISGLK